MIIDEIILTNVGPYGGENRIPLSPRGKRRPITLVQAHNGAGKTTLLDAMNLCLYGKHAPLAKQGGGTYAEYLRRLIWDGADPLGGSSVVVQVRYQLSGRERIERIARHWRSTGSGIREECSVSVQNDDREFVLDRVLSDRAYEHIEELLPVRLAPLFFFDGERIKELANPEKSRELLKTAIHALLGLDLIDQLSADLGSVKRRAQLTAAKEQDTGVQAEVEALQAEMAKKDEEIRELKNEHARITTSADHLGTTLRKAEQALQAKGGDLLSQRRELEQNRAVLEHRLLTAQSRIRELLAGDAPLLHVRDHLAAIEAESSLEFSSESMKAALAAIEVRDRELLVWIKKHHPEASSAIAQHLASDRNNRLSSASIAATSHGLTSIERAELKALLDGGLGQIEHEMDGLHREVAECQSGIETLTRTLSRVPDQDALETILSERAMAQAELRTAEKRLGEIAKQIEESSAARNRLQARLERQLGEIAARGFADQQQARRVSASDGAVACLVRFRASVLERDVREISEHITTCYEKLMQKKGMVRSISIDPITYDVRLIGGSSRRQEFIQVDDLSAGECQLLATAMLWGLARASDRPLPMIIDTPVGRLDAQHRSNLLSFYFPKAAHQVLLLSTDTEITRADERALDDSMARRITLKYDDSRGATTVSVKEAS